MTDIDIIRMAKEAGGDDWGIFRDFMPEIERFAELVAAAEREACAKLCDAISTAARKDWKAKYNPHDDGRCDGAFECAESIRARGQG